jgi:hypothetical protein
MDFIVWQKGNRALAASIRRSICWPLSCMTWSRKSLGSQSLARRTPPLAYCALLVLGTWKRWRDHIGVYCRLALSFLLFFARPGTSRGSRSCRIGDETEWRIRRNMTQASVSKEAASSRRMRMNPRTTDGLPMRAGRKQHADWTPNPRCEGGSAGMKTGGKSPSSLLGTISPSSTKSRRKRHPVAS